ncbi:hypothetical protein ECE50_026415 [Chitinophaga sp. Mgbs1]|uniref:Uncharacterized protein n=1 Tax=Chitinophaga solisilvae TaxID=1233460 RepID=A0A3S1CZQ4_9BACT|nr:hypothetical protein [Chitinophaga solisilvae]
MENNKTPQEITEINKSIERNSKMLAFGLYLDEGMKAVERVFPEYKHFVLENKNNSFGEVKRKLFTFNLA